MNNLEIITKQIHEIKPNPNNAKVHTAEQLEQIKESIKDFGFNDPVAVDENNMIIEGHGRYLAANEMGINELPVVVIEGLSEEQKTAYALIHNKLTMNTALNIDTLQQEMEEIDSFDMSKYSFNINDETYFDYKEKQNAKPKRIKAYPKNDEEEATLKQYLEDNNIKYKIK